MTTSVEETRIVLNPFLLNAATLKLLVNEFDGKITVWARIAMVKAIREIFFDETYDSLSEIYFRQMST